MSTCEYCGNEEQVGCCWVDTIVDLRAQLAAVKVENNHLALTRDMARGERDAAIARAEEAEKERDEAVDGVRKLHALVARGDHGLRDNIVCAVDGVIPWKEAAITHNKEREASDARADASERACVDAERRAEAAERVVAELMEHEAWQPREAGIRRLVRYAMKPHEKNRERADKFIASLNLPMLDALAASVALGEQFAAVRAEERAAIVAWLREEQALGGSVNYADAIGAIKTAEHEEGT